MLSNLSTTLEIQLQIYSQTESYPDLEDVQLKSLGKIKTYSLERLQNETNYSILNDKMRILKEHISFLRSLLTDINNNLLSQRCGSHRTNRYLPSDCVNCYKAIVDASKSCIAALKI